VITDDEYRENQDIAERTPTSVGTLTIAYVGLLLFTIGYYNRPEDFLGGRYLPIQLIGGFLAIGSYIAYLVFGGRITRKRETTILVLLLGWLILSIPFSNWMGGSFQVLKDSISKILLLTIVITNACTTVTRVRNLLIVQIFSVTLMAWLARDSFDTAGRLAGDNNTAFGNSNDLAVVLCISLPLLFFFFLEGSNYLKKTIYVGVMLFVLYILFLTFSRTGFLALVVAVVALAWHFGIKRGHYVRVTGLAILLLVVLVALVPSGYGKMIASIFSSDVDVSGTVREDAAESRVSRQLLFNRAVELTIKHPIFGVGLNQFEDLSGISHVEHNTYLQFSTEAGIPALLLFLSLVGCTVVNLRGAERLSTSGSEVWRLAGALRASHWALLVGACFTNYGYEFFPYYIFGLAAALHQIALNQAEHRPDAFAEGEPDQTPI